ncbi:MAG: tRNA (adenosine(37)-N6)-threonylcarbamoyltransferase complex dimerization subunit type 1 TsaB [Dehalococcoidia bacterium]|nr:tRNA (adenosine(37)-N6)-threonylcarbamoyltransferase complex dimerization subunit type 1 TsaB [Dehalococcoidia bacterium]
MSTILCIDTASDAFALAADRDGTVRSVEVDGGHDHSRLLLPAIGDLLGGERPAAILVVIGPGAYAGIRVGIATAEGLSLSYGVPVYSIGTLEAAALAAGRANALVIHPAGRGEFATQEFRGADASGNPRLSGPDGLAGQPLVGEDAGELGGREVAPRERCEAALRGRAPKIRAGTLEPGAEAFYLREPSITLSRRQQAAS